MIFIKVDLINVKLNADDVVINTTLCFIIHLCFHHSLMFRKATTACSYVKWFLVMFSLCY